MRRKLWAWTKFIALALAVGIIPFTPEIPVPFALAFLVLLLLASTPVLCQRIGRLYRRIVVPSAPPAKASFTFDRRWIRRPEDPGIPGSAHPRAPSSFSAALR